MCAQIAAQAAGFPAQLLSSQIRRTAVCDYLTRAFGDVIAASGTHTVCDRLLVKLDDISELQLPQVDNASRFVSA